MEFTFKKVDTFETIVTRPQILMTMQSMLFSLYFSHQLGVEDGRRWPARKAYKGRAWEAIMIL
jgi:hypothetical protein